MANQGRITWIQLSGVEGPIRPGFFLATSEIGNFSIVSNSAGGTAAKEYSIQLQTLLEGFTSAGMSILRIEVDSSEVADLEIEKRVLALDYPIDMNLVQDHLALRKRISAAQKPIGQRAGDRGGNGNKRIKIHVGSNSESGDEFVAGVLALGGPHRLNSSALGSQVIAQIHTLTRVEIQNAIDEWIREGRDSFFERHRVNSAFKYKIAIGEELFDAKAIIVGALRSSRPQLGNFKTTAFNGNAETVAKPLRQLGFDVVDLEQDQAEHEDESHQRTILDRHHLGPVEKQQLVKARRGQGVFRDNVEAREPFCRITRVSNPRYLRASHIKPWRKSSDSEKLDGNNGLMLAPHIDFLFDRGLISFEDDGKLIVSAQIEENALEAWGIPLELNVGPFSAEQSVYLKFHRENELKH
jgi:hypothetical protein